MFLNRKKSSSSRQSYYMLTGPYLKHLCSKGWNNICFCHESHVLICVISYLFKFIHLHCVALRCVALRCSTYHSHLSKIWDLVASSVIIRFHRSLEHCEFDSRLSLRKFLSLQKAWLGNKKCPCYFPRQVEADLQNNLVKDHIPISLWTSRIAAVLSQTILPQAKLSTTTPTLSVTTARCSVNKFTGKPAKAKRSSCTKPSLR